jgi:hypothetical protein
MAGAVRWPAVPAWEGQMDKNRRLTVAAGSAVRGPHRIKHPLIGPGLSTRKGESFMARDVEDVNLSGKPALARLCNFPTGKSDCLPSHEKWVRAELKPLLDANPNAWVDLIGLASKLGFASGDSAEKNRKLSEARIESVKRLIQRCALGARINVTLPEGDTQSAGGARNDDGYWRAVLIKVYGITQPVAPGSTPPAPGTQAIRIVKFYFNAFIPRDVPRLTFPVLNGPHKGETFVLGPPVPGVILPDPPAINPFLLDPPLPVPASPPPQDFLVRGAFLTNNRGFESSDTRAINHFKMHAEVTVDFTADLPMVRDKAVIGGESIQIEPVTGAEIQKKIGDTSRMSITRLVTVPVANPFFRPSSKSVAFQINLASPIPTIPLSGLIADIDVIGLLVIDPEGTVSFSGKVDSFPAFEAYVMVNQFKVHKLFQLGPDSDDSPLNLPGPPTRPVSVVVGISGPASA